MYTHRPLVPVLNARLCRQCANAAVIAAAGFLLINTVLWLVPDWSPIVARGMANLQTESISLTPSIRIVGLVGSTCYLGILGYGLWHARTLFLRLAEGSVFETDTGLLLRRIGICLLAYAALTPFVAALMALLVTSNNRVGERVVHFGVSDHEVVLGLVSALLLAIGSVMAEATRLAEDSRQIV